MADVCPKMETALGANHPHVAHSQPPVRSASGLPGRTIASGPRRITGGPPALMVVRPSTLVSEGSYQTSTVVLVPLALVTVICVILNDLPGGDFAGPGA